MNITVKVDEISLASTVAAIISQDEETGEPYEAGQQTIGDLVAGQIVDRLVSREDWYEHSKRLAEIRAELIRETIRPQIEEAIAHPITSTNRYGEPTGEPTTLTALIVDEARKAITAPVDNAYGRDRQTWLSKTVADEVRKALGKEIAEAVKTARAEVAGQIGQQVAAAVQAGLRAR